MKLLITAKGTGLTDTVDPRFGRAPYFILVDTETAAAVWHGNHQNLNAPQGAGIQAAEAAVRLGAGTVITGHVGPKAFRVLRAAGIRVCLVGEMNVGEAVAKFTAGQLSEVAAANVEGH